MKYTFRYQPKYHENPYHPIALQYRRCGNLKIWLTYIYHCHFDLLSAMILWVYKVVGQTSVWNVHVLCYLTSRHSSVHVKKRWLWLRSSIKNLTTFLDKSLRNTHIKYDMASLNFWASCCCIWQEAGLGYL